MGQTRVKQQGETEKEQRKKRKGIGIHPTRGPLQLFSRGCAYARTTDDAAIQQASNRRNVVFSHSVCD